MKKVAIYIRVSTQEQAQEGYSVGEQKERLIAYCTAHAWMILEIYVDGGYSGSNLKRPAIQKLITEVNNFDIVLVYKLDRLSRSQRDTLYLIEEVFLPNKVDFVSMQESFDTSSPLGKAMIGLLAVFAQLEREQIKERTMMGRIARAKSGLHHGGGYSPIGYDYKDGKLVINAYEAEQIKKIYDWYLEGLSLDSIIKRLKEKGYTNRYTSYRYWTTLRYILRNPAYIGCIRFGDVVIENAHEAIISKEKFQAVQDMIKQRYETYGRNSFQSKHLLTGVIFCGYCGARYFYRSIKTKFNTKKYPYYYYSCHSRIKVSSKMVRDPNCNNKHWKAKELENIVESRIRELLQSPEIAQEIMAQKQSKPIETNADSILIEKRIKEIDREIGKFMELYKIDGIPPEILGDNINKLYTEKTALQSAIKPDEEMVETSFDLVEELLKNAAQIWDFADESQKRRILQDLIKKITLTGDEVDIEWNF